MKIQLSKTQWEYIGKTAGWIRDFPQIEKPTFTYHINLDERGSFLADVRDPSGKTVFEIKDGNELKPGESSIFEDGFMKHKRDLSGLGQYLMDLGIMRPTDKLIGDGI